ncbi:MAG: tripartite tricarboxylate transporter permease [Thermoplasmata archaeon]|nr:tripartite tricarboxylate transporter permease [Thermoplasmata archaeon]
MHDATVAAFLLAFQVGLFAAVGSLGSVLGAEMEEASLFVAVLIIGMLVTHTFLDIIPSIFLGAPDEDTALSVLPGHRLMKQGRGYEAIKCSALGSFGAVFVALLAVFPARVIMGSPANAYDALMPLVPWMLIGITAMMVLGERSSMDKVWPKRKAELEAQREEVGFRDHLRQKAFAFFLFLLTGCLGLVVLRSPLATYNWLPFPHLRSSMLFPLFTGLFGISGLFLSLWDEVQMAPQETEGVKVGLSRRASTKGVVAGSFAGGLVGWFPGISSASATVVAQAITNRGEKEDADKEFIVAVSGVNTGQRHNECSSPVCHPSSSLRGDAGCGHGTGQ